jgi:Flp pilus assembly protein TadD
VAQARKGEHEDAASSFSKVKELDPHDSSAWYHLGNSYIHLGMLDKAEDCLNEAIKLNPENTQAFFLLEKVGEIKRSGAMEY